MPLVEIPIVYEDSDAVVVNKPAGIAVHPGAGYQGDVTVSEWFSAQYPEAADVGEGRFRSGIVHRLDKDTSGVLILAKTRTAHEHFKKQFQDRAVTKLYKALVHGVPKEPAGIVDQPLARSSRDRRRQTIIDSPDAREAITEWRVAETFDDDYTLLELQPKTGRTHQIRAHLHWLGHPVVGDELYTFKRFTPPSGVKRQMLHAQSLTVSLRSGGQQTFTAELPDDFQSALDLLANSGNGTTNNTPSSSPPTLGGE